MQDIWSKEFLHFGDIAIHILTVAFMFTYFFVSIIHVSVPYYLFYKLMILQIYHA